MRSESLLKKKTRQERERQVVCGIQRRLNIGISKMRQIMECWEDLDTSIRLIFKIVESFC